MRGWLPAAALGGLLALLAIGAVLVLRPPADAPPARADALAGELRCPDCAGLSVADSPTRSAQEIRRQIDELVAQGASDEEIRQRFVSRYGEWILLAPRSPAAWIIPFAVIAAAAVGLGAWLARRDAHRPPPPSLSVEERRRVHDEVEALDA